MRFAATTQVSPNNGSINFLEECLKTTKHLTETVYYNICNNTEQSVPLGIFDYLTDINIYFLGLLMGAIFGFIIKFAWDFKD